MFHGKKRLSFLLASVLCLGFCANLFACKEKPLLEYALSDCGTYYNVSGYDEERAGYHRQVDIPSTHKGLLVKRILDGAFRDNGWLQKISIPQTVDEIGDDAFYGCNDLESIDIPNVSLLTKIGDRAFYGCNSLQTAILPNGVKSIGKEVFCGCDDLAVLRLPEYLAEIPEGAFMGCANLEPFLFPETVTKIGAWAFYGCLELTRVQLPAQLESIGEGGFAESGIERITLPENIVSIEPKTFFNCSRLLSVTADEVTIIKESAFEDCTNLSSSPLTAKVERIEKRAYKNCTHLSAPFFENCLTHIGEEAFYRCGDYPRWLSIDIPSSVTEIGKHAFGGLQATKLDIYTEVTEKPSGWAVDWFEQSESEEHKITVIWKE